MINQLSKSFAVGMLMVTLLSADRISQDSSSAISAGGKERVALLPPECRGFSSDEIAHLNQSFGSGLAESKRFTVLQEAVLKTRLGQAGLTSLDSCKTMTCLARAGRVLKVDKVVRIEAERWEQRFMLHIQMVRSSDAALLYDERVDYSGEISTFSSTISAEQGRKLAAAYLDKKPNWLLIGFVVIGGMGLIVWLLKRLQSTKSPVPLNNPSQRLHS